MQSSTKLWQRIRLDPETPTPARAEMEPPGLVLENGFSALAKNRPASKIRRNGVLWASLTLMVGVGLLTALQYFFVDGWPSATLVAFGPKWPLLVLPVSMAPLAWRWHRRSIMTLAATSSMILGPLMGLRLNPQLRTAPERDPATSLRLITFNAAERPNAGRLGSILLEQHPDIVTLQEWPPEAIHPFGKETGWHLARSGHLLVASRFPIVSTSEIVAPSESWRTVALRTEILTPLGTVNVVSIHLMTPRTGIEAVLSGGLAGMPRLREVNRERYAESEYVRNQIESFRGPTLIAGDFNMTTNSQIYDSVWGKYANAYSLRGTGWGSTKYTRWHGVRIDHVLADRDWDVYRCVVGGPLGSDHRPVVVDLNRLPSSDSRDPRAPRRAS